MKLISRLFFLQQNKKFAAAALVLFFMALPARTQETGGFFSELDWFVRGSMLFLLENNGNDSAPTPILPSLGGGVSHLLQNNISLELSLDVYGTTYNWQERLQRAVAANDETRDAFVVGCILGLQPVFRFNSRRDIFTIRAYGGLSFDMRFIFRAYGLKDSEEQSIDNIRQARKNIASYFWGNGRFIYPMAGVGIDFPIFENSQLGIDLRAWFPIWRVWSGENLPAVDSLRFAGGFRLSF